ncbi:hypothetical protein B296_00039909, partial [Ensete ventricosum]
LLKEARVRVRKMDDELLQSVKALENARAELSRQAVDHYKELAASVDERRLASPPAGRGSRAAVGWIPLRRGFGFRDDLIITPSIKGGTIKGGKGSYPRCLAREYWSTEVHDSGPSSANIILVGRTLVRLIGVRGIVRFGCTHTVLPFMETESSKRRL